MRKEKNRRFAILITVMILLLILLCFFSMNTGFTDLSPSDVLRIRTWNPGGEAGAV